MLKNFKSGYAVSGSDQTANSEKNDCVVRAIANACDVNYSQAHKYVKEKFDRKKGSGVKYFQTIMDKTNTMSFDEAGQLDMFNEGAVHSVKSLGKMPKFGGDLINPKYKHKKVAFTVKAFAQKYNVGKFIVAVNAHALAIVNGVVMDNDNYQYGGYRRVVEGACQVQ